MLDEVRERWEGDLSLVAEKEDQQGNRLLVVCRDSDQYRCLRYFKIGDSWEVSVDGDRVSAETAMKWLVDPSAMTCRKAEHPEEFED